MTSFPIKKFYQNEVIFKEGTLGTVAYILREGGVEISVEVEGSKKVLTVLKPITVFGEMALVLPDHQRTATAAAADCSEVVEIAKSDFDDYIDSSPAVIAAALKALVDRLRETTVRLKSPETMNIY